MADIELPPLPDWMSRFQIPADNLDDSDFSWLDSRMKDYARTAVKAALEAALVDAERYRLLRKGAVEDVAVVRGLGAMDYGMSAVVSTYSEEIDGDDLDAAIDAAQAQPKRRPYNASASLSEYGIFPECDAAPAAQAPRACTCHPDDRPDGPCRERYAASECQADVEGGWRRNPAMAGKR